MRCIREQGGGTFSILLDGISVSARCAARVTNDGPQHSPGHAPERGQLPPQ
jgi:hypothetical protein